MRIPKLPPRTASSHKGTYGRVLLVGGSRGMAGAIALAGMSASKSGAGLVTLAVPDCCLETVAGFDPNYMTTPLPCDTAGRLRFESLDPIHTLTANAQSVGIGPGLSQSDDIKQVVLEIYRDCPIPMVVDADALNALATQTDCIAQAAGPRVLTPHIGEFRRLIGQDLSVDECRATAMQFAAQHKIVLVLKGHRSLVTDGTTLHENETGNPGMATGGSGDVLTGVITSLLAQNLRPLDAAVLAVHIHGLAGDIARDALGETSLVASDIKDNLNAAFRQMSE